MSAPSGPHPDHPRLGGRREFTLILSVGLVVMVIFLFLRNVWATIIPSITVPMALVATFGVDVPARLQPGQSVADGH